VKADLTELSGYTRPPWGLSSIRSRLPVNAAQSRTHARLAAIFEGGDGSCGEDPQPPSRIERLSNPYQMRRQPDIQAHILIDLDECSCGCNAYERCVRADCPHHASSSGLETEPDADARTEKRRDLTRDETIEFRWVRKNAISA
jgi:hypothetical protein